MQDASEYDAPKDIFISQLAAHIKKLDEKLSTLSRTTQKQLDEAGTQFDDIETSSNLEEYIRTQTAKLKEALDDPETNPEAAEEIELKLGGVLGAISASFTDRTGNLDLSQVELKAAAHSILEAAEIKGDLYINQIVFAVAKEKRRDRSRIQSFDEFKQELDDLKETTNKLKDQLFKESLEASLAYQLCSAKDRRTMIKDSLELFKTLMSQVNLDDSDTNAAINKAFNEYIFRTCANLSKFTLGKDGIALKRLYACIDENTSMQAGIESRNGVDTLALQPREHDDQVLKDLVQSDFFEQVYRIIGIPIEKAKT